MKRKIRVFIPAAAVLAIALVAAGCGSSAGGSSYSSAAYGSAVQASAPSGIDGAARVGVANSRLGRIVVDNKGRTLYHFEKDKTVAAPATDCAQRTAAAAQPRQAYGSHRCEAVAARSDPACKRQRTSHLRGPSALPVRRGQAGGPDQGRGLTTSARAGTCSPAGKKIESDG